MYQNVPVIFNRAGRSKQRFLDPFISFLSTLHIAVHIYVHGLDRQLEYKGLKSEKDHVSNFILFYGICWVRLKHLLSEIIYGTVPVYCVIMSRQFVSIPGRCIDIYWIYMDINSLFLTRNLQYLNWYMSCKNSVMNISTSSVWQKPPVQHCSCWHWCDLAQTFQTWPQILRYPEANILCSPFLWIKKKKKMRRPELKTKLILFITFYLNWMIDCL